MVTSGEQFEAAISAFIQEHPARLRQFIDVNQLKFLLARYAATWTYREGSLNVPVNLLSILTDLCEMLGFTKDEFVYILGAECSRSLPEGEANDDNPDRSV
jgi:hypothetical protein